MLQNWKNALDKGNYACAILMDLSKAFGTINHDTICYKQNLKHAICQRILWFFLMCNYVKNRKQSVVIINSTVVAGVPQGSKDGPLL